MQNNKLVQRPENLSSTQQAELNGELSLEEIDEVSGGHNFNHINPMLVSSTIGAHLTWGALNPQPLPPRILH